MRAMTNDEHMDMQATILYHLSLCIDNDAAIKVADSTAHDGKTVMEAVMDDIKISSDWENSGHYNDDDVRLAIGRVLAKRLCVNL